MRKPRPYPTEITEDAWAFVAPYLTVIATQSPQRQYDVRVMFNALRWIIRAGAPWRLLPNDPMIFRLGRQSVSKPSVGCMADVLKPAAPIDGLSCA